MAASQQPSGDILVRLWNEVINPDPEGQWLRDFVRQPDSASHPVAGAKAAMEEVLAAGISREDLGRHARYIRWSTITSVLYKFGDPGLEDGRLAGLPEAFAEGPRRTRERKFFSEVWPDGDPEYASREEAKPDSTRWEECIAEEKRAAGRIFGDVPPALERLRAQGLAYKTLMTLQTWHQYEATFHTLRLVGEHFDDAEELSGLDEELLGAEPSGRGAAGGSWPLPAFSRSVRQVSASGSQESPADPLFALRGMGMFSFSPDGHVIAACGKTAPIRIVSARDGTDIATCKFLKEEICSLQFSPASDSLAAIHTGHINFFDAGTGSLLRQVRRGDVESLQWWRSDGGDVLFFIRWLSDNASNPGYKFEIRESESLRPIAEAPFRGIEGRLFNFKLSPDGRRAGLAWRAPWGGCPFMTVWSWPECALLGQWGMPFEHWAWSPDGQRIATLDVAEIRRDDVSKKHITVREGRGCVLKDAVSGNIVWAAEKPDNDPPRFAISPDGEWLVSGTFHGHITIWSIAGQKIAREFQLKGMCFDLQLSPDGRILGVASDPQCIFWDFQKLTMP